VKKEAIKLKETDQAKKITADVEKEIATANKATADAND
jgi:hypothetical protein